ncbi:MAG: hypothetical protein ACI8WY_002095 [Planctomycetota bacterium]|jgi:hypothetical protein
MRREGNRERRIAGLYERVGQVREESGRGTEFCLPRPNKKASGAAQRGRKGDRMTTVDR